MADRRRMSLGASIRGLGYHTSAWRHPNVLPGASESLSHFTEAARIAAAAKFDMVFFADGLAVRGNDRPAGALSHSHENVELEPTTLLAALAVQTRHIGLVATASTSYNEPYHVARTYASIDHISGGRAGWNAVTSWSEQEALNFSREAHYDRETRYERADEFIEVVRKLWASWEPDAFMHDRKTGRFYDPEKLHAADHRGHFFRVRGPLTSSHTPQGQPVIFQAGDSERGIALAARHAEAVYTIPQTLEDCIRHRKAMDTAAARFGRAPGSVRILPGVQIVTGRTEAEVAEKLMLYDEIADPVIAMARAWSEYGDLSGYDLDAPVPADLQSSDRVSAMRHLGERAKAEGWQLRRLLREYGAGSLRVLAGTPDKIAAEMQEWFGSGACDGFNILPQHLPGGLADVTELVVPILQERGLFRREYEGGTLREHLGLPAAAAVG
ncbi:LLM class flavin-dependent oxidoreductase [Rhizobium puerariae]|uniref:LLM class flavin-dependent oxidoreductase n=1 Tax=Rhizobium puerariae TaxID=1585791 RepID=A0ABV6AHB4_9HYPH